MARSTEMSPRTKARLAGAFYLLTMLLGIFAQVGVSERLIVVGNAAATASNIVTQESFFRLGYAVYLIEMACQITMTVLFFDLLKPVSKGAALLAATFSLTGCIIKTVSRVFFASPLLVLGGAHYLTVFSEAQLEALALLVLRVNYLGETTAVVFFGLYAIVKGYLVFRSTFLPRILGVLSAAGGVGWLTYLYEPLAVRVLAVVMAAALVGALAIIGWLLVVGVHEDRWREQASAARESIWQ
ncbi:MAG: DUF4386 domain-containing protein [Gemmatimonadaceae bacterium]|nr:DUF4386 domain-containing protein [Gemmatimonadaceae bacterium]